MLGRTGRPYVPIWAGLHRSGMRLSGKGWTQVEVCGLRCWSPGRSNANQTPGRSPDSDATRRVGESQPASYESRASDSSDS